MTHELRHDLAEGGGGGGGWVTGTHLELSFTAQQLIKLPSFYGDIQPHLDDTKENMRDTLVNAIRVTQSH